MPLPADAPGPAVVAVEEDAVSDLRDRRENPAALMRARRIRYYGPALRSPAAERAVIDLVTTCLLGVPDSTARNSSARSAQST
jgi:hypothetical protein